MPVTLVAVTGLDLIAADYEEVLVGTVAKSPTSAKVNTARLAYIRVEGGPIRYLVHGGVPTAIFGHPAYDLDALWLNSSEIRNLQMIRTGGVSGTVRITYYQ